MENIKITIRGFFSQFFKSGDLQDETDIFALGVVNSLLAIQLVTYIEKEFDLTIENEDLDFDNFRSVNAIAELVGRKTRVPQSEMEYRLAS